MSSTDTDKVPKNPYTDQRKSPHFEATFANAFALRFGENDCTLYTIMSDDPKRLREGEVQASVIMTPRSAKALALLLLDSLVEFETRAGQEFLVADERRIKMYKAAKAAWEPKDKEKAD